MQPLRYFLLYLALIIFTGVLPSAARAEHTDTEISASFIELAGVWESEGYGHILHIRSGAPMTVDFYHSTSVSCMLTFSGPVDSLQNAYVHVLRNADTSRFTYMSSGSITTYAYNRIGQLPVLCQNGGTGPNNDPVFNFDVLWETFNEQYAFFAERDVDWNALRDQLRPQLNAGSSDDDLFNVLVELITPLCDGHVELATDFNEYNSAFNPACGVGLFLHVLEQFNNQNTYDDPYEYYVQVFRPAVLDLIETHYLQGNLSSAANGKILWGDLGAGVGYLNILQMANLAGDESDAPDDLAVLGLALDQAMATFADKHTLVLDLRLNSGGYDHVVQDMAGRFSGQPRIAFTKKTRWGDGHTATQVHTTRPVVDAQFLGPVIILTSGLTASASENLLLAMHDLPQVTTVGEKTLGVHSDTLDRRLPNGWEFSLSNEVFADARGTVFEGSGFMPDVEVESLRSSDIDIGRDAAIEAALELVAFPSIYPGLGGTWWNTGRGGEGYTFDFFTLGATRYLFVTFYTYDANGNQAYLVGVTTDFSNPVMFNLGITSGGVFGPDYNPANQSEVPWGTLTVDFHNCTQATITLTPSMQGFEGYSTTLERLGENPFEGGNCS